MRKRAIKIEKERAIHIERVGRSKGNDREGKGRFYYKKFYKF